MPFNRFWMRVCGAVLLALVLCAALGTVVELGESSDESQRTLTATMLRPPPLPLGMRTVRCHSVGPY